MKRQKSMRSSRPRLCSPPRHRHARFCGSAAALSPVRDRDGPLPPWDGSAVVAGRRRTTKSPNVVADTEALLTPSTPVVVRMETLRRASLYASTECRDSQTELLEPAVARVDASETSGRADAHGAPGCGLCGRSVSGNRKPVGRDFAARAEGARPRSATRTAMR